MALSDAAVRAAKPGETQFKLYDEGGLFLIIRPSGGKLWRLKYRHLGKEQQLTVGRYPDVGLKEARERRDEARKIIAKGGNPAFEKKRAAVAASVGAANTFSAIAEELIAKREREGLKDITTGKAEWLLSLLAPQLGRRPIADIEAFELLDVLKKVETSGRLETVNGGAKPGQCSGVKPGHLGCALVTHPGHLSGDAWSHCVAQRIAAGCAADVSAAPGGGSGGRLNRLWISPAWGYAGRISPVSGSTLADIRRRAVDWARR